MDASLIKLQTQAVDQKMPAKSVFQIKFSPPNLTFGLGNSICYDTWLLLPCPSRSLPSPFIEQLHAGNASEKCKNLIIQSTLYMQCKEKIVAPQLST